MPNLFSIDTLSNIPVLVLHCSIIYVLQGTLMFDAMAVGIKTKLWTMLEFKSVPNFVNVYYNTRL